MYAHVSSLYFNSSAVDEQTPNCDWDQAKSLVALIINSDGIVWCEASLLFLQQQLLKPNILHPSRFWRFPSALT